MAYASTHNHYVVAFDQSIGMNRPYYLNPGILKTIDNLLSENGFDRDSDFVSMVAYTMEMGNPSIERFVRPYTSDNKPVLWHQLNGKSLSEMFPKWPEGQPLLDLNSTPFGSMQSLSKPYIIMETKENKDSMALAKQKYLLLVSDEIVNGTDDNYAQEWNSVSTSYGANTNKFRAISSGVFETMKHFNEEFKFIETTFSNAGKKLNKIPLSADGRYKIIPYEVVSVERPSIHSVTDIPSPLPLKRVKGGFRLDIDGHSLVPKYEILDVVITGDDGNILGVSDNGAFDMVIPSGRISAGDSLKLSLTLLLKDGMYDGAVISPENPRYRDGMVVKQVVKIQNEENILGFIPLYDSFWWWYPNDIVKAVMTWNVIIIVIFIIVICIVAYKLFWHYTRYVPDNKYIELKEIA